MSAEGFDLDAYLRNARGWYAYLNQGEVWFPNKRPRVRIADMDAAWRLNCTRFLERRAASIERRYTFGEISALSEPKYRNVVGERDGEVVLTGPALSESDLMSDSVADMFDQGRDDRMADPIAWLRATALYRSLAAGLPDCSVALEALNERARHWSTCPARESTDAECRCSEIRASQEATA
jgi:hypothetical protein